MANKYTVYHIPGIKVGCTKDIKRRCRDNKNKYGQDITIDIIMVTDNIDEASELEEFANAEYNYRKDITYKESQRMVNSINHCSNSQETRDKISDTLIGKELSEEHLQKMRDNQPDRSGENNPFYGVAHSDETRHKMSQSKMGKTGEACPNYGRVHKKKVCPHCGLCGGGGNMKRFHFDNCKEAK